MPDTAWCILGFFMVLMVIGAMLISYEAYSDREVTGNLELASWARENNYQIRALEVKGPKGSAGPFAGKISLGQYVYRVVVTPIGGEKRRVAWIRLGSGLTSSADEFTLIWEDEWRPPDPPMG